MPAVISTGELADFVILADDPHTVSPDKIRDVQIVRTVVGGTTMYRAWVRPMMDACSVGVKPLQPSRPRPRCR